MKHKYLLGLLSACLFLLGASAFAYPKRDLPEVDLVSRVQRGADENRLLSKDTGYDGIKKKRKEDEAYMTKLKEEDFEAYMAIKEKNYEAQKKSAAADNYLTTTFAEQYHIDERVDKLRGHELWRPLKYHYKKQQIIIHHTADEAEAMASVYDEIKEMQRIYEFHTFYRGRGDIGYHFIIGPSGKIYEGKAGGPGVVGGHAKYNNTSSIGISLMGNFEIQEPTRAQLQSLITLTSSLAKKYKIDPNIKSDYHKAAKVDPYILDEKNYNIAGHKDAGRTACPGKKLYDKLSYVRVEVTNNLNSNQKEGSFVNKKNTSADKLAILNKASLQKYAAKSKIQYQKAYGELRAKNTMQKLAKAPDLARTKELLGQEVSVLLYELSTDYDTRTISCDKCTATVTKTNGKSSSFETKIPLTLRKTNKSLLLVSNNKAIPLEKFHIRNTSSDSLITVRNYDRKSFAGIGRNTFRGSIDIAREPVFLLDQDKTQEIFTVTNSVSLDDYLAGIVETNDQNHLDQNKILALLSKNYMLFYMDKANEHPNIPTEANYNAIDDPRLFQKYAGAGVEKTLKKRNLALKLTKDEIVTYKDTLPILPYFSCSPGFTRTAAEKWGRSDTPYLATKLDFVSCDTFEGHGVGLSGRGAQVLAEKNISYKDILAYYYPGTEVKKIEKLVASNK